MSTTSKACSPKSTSGWTRRSSTCGTSSPACAPAAPRSTILDSVHVEAYGSKMPLNQVAGLSIPEPTLIVAQPFDPSLLGAIEKAIRARTSA